jgi:hypothetical protein
LLPFLALVAITDEPRWEDDHAQSAAGFPFTGDFGGNFYDLRLGARLGIGGLTSKQQYAKHCIDPGFFRHME